MMIGKKSRLLLLNLAAVTTLLAQPPQWWKDVHNYDGTSDWNTYMTYTPAYFGPNALPVPELSDGRIATKHVAELSTDFFWGYGDQTQSFSTRLTYVFIPGRLAVTGWGVLAEHYRTTTAVRDQRASQVEKAEETFLIGDLYLSTQIGLLKEGHFNPDLMLDIILKTASSKTASNARYFDTPGYCFNLTAGKSFSFPESFIQEIRFAANIGFLCYQLNSHFQNDAPVYGGNVRLFSGNWFLETGVGGYSGWTADGDRPFVLRSKISYGKNAIHYFMQYQHALRDYPFRRLQTGVSFEF